MKKKLLILLALSAMALPMAGCHIHGGGHRHHGCHSHSGGGDVFWAALRCLRPSGRRAGMLTVDRTVQRRLTAARLATMAAVRAALHL